MEINLLYSLFLIVTPFFMFFLASNYFTHDKVKNLPPGPKPLPIIGNMHQMGKKPHVSTAMMAKKYGQLMSLRLGSRLLVVASSPEAAHEILKAQDRQLSGRIVPDSFRLSVEDYHFVWAHDCNDHWKSLRSIFRTDLFSVKAIEAQTNLRNKKLAEMSDFLESKQGKVVKIEEVVFTTLFNLMSNILFSKDFLDMKDESKTVNWMKKSLQKALENSMTPNISDFYPAVARFDLQGLRKDSFKQLHAVSNFTDVIIEERRRQTASSTVTNEKDFLDRLLECNFTNSQINILVLELFIAGTDTVTATIEWAMAELLKNKNIMEKLQEELKPENKSNSLMDFDLSKLPYFNSFIKEVLRLHPVVPVLIPRRAIEACEVMNYTIPKNSQIWVNIWAISRDPKVWEDPESFIPERFLGSDLDFTGHDFEFTPFGGGRRMCPGLPFGVKSLEAILAFLILEFDWVLPNNEDPATLDMDEHFGVTLQKANLLNLSSQRKSNN